MTRRTRTAALVSAAALLVSGSISLGFAGSALAADEPVAAPAALLPALVLDPTSPDLNDVLNVSGSACFDPSGTAGAIAGTVNVTVTSDTGFNSNTPVDPGTDGNWSTTSATGFQGFTLDQAGKYSVDATCTLTVGGLPLSNDYPTATFTITAPTTPPTPTNPVVIPNPTSVAPGGQVSVGGSGFDTTATSATVELAGIGTKNATLSGGSFSGLVFAVPSTQPAGAVKVTVTPNVGDPATSSITVTQPSVDGSVPTSNPTAPATTGNTTTSNSGSGFDGSSGNSGGTTTTAKPKLPNTGADTVWPGVVGGLLVLTGAGLLWAGRRREDAEPTAA